MNKLEITEIQIIPIRAERGLVGFASCVVNNQFYIGNIAIHSAFLNTEFRLVYPTRTFSNEKSVSCIHPINKETGEAMQDAICKAYKRLILQQNNPETHGDLWTK